MSKIFKLLLFIVALGVAAIDLLNMFDLIKLLISDFETTIALIDLNLALILIRMVGAILIVLGTLMGFLKVFTKLGMLLVIGVLSYEIIDVLLPIVQDETLRQALIDGIPDSIIEEALILLGFLFILLSQKGILFRLLMAAGFGYVIYLNYEVYLLVFESIDFANILDDSISLGLIQSALILACGVFWPLYYPKKKQNQKLSRR